MMARLKTLKPRLQTLKTAPKTATINPKSTRGRGRGGRPWRRKREQIFKRDIYTCQDCGRIGTPEQGKLSSLELDHIVNLAQGGTDTDSNLQTLCHECHSKKTQNESQYRLVEGKKVVNYQSMPDWLPSNTNATLVFGASGSGKSTWAKDNRKQGQAVIDLDEIASTLTGKPLYHRNKEDTGLAIRERNKLIADLAKDNRPCIIILTGEKRSQRDWWINKIKPSQVVIMDTSKADCIERIRNDDRRPDHVKAQQIESVNLWEVSP